MNSMNVPGRLLLFSKVAFSYDAFSVTRYIFTRSPSSPEFSFGAVLAFTTEVIIVPLKKVHATFLLVFRYGW